MANTMFEALLKECKTMRQIFECQTALADGLSDDEVLELRAKYAGLTVQEAKSYQDALSTLKGIENKPVKAQLEEVQNTLLSVICR